MDNDPPPAPRPWLAAERALIGILLVHTGASLPAADGLPALPGVDALPAVQAELGPNGAQAFTERAHRLVYRALERLAERDAPRDPFAVAAALDGTDGWDGDVDFLLWLTAGSESDAAAGYVPTPAYAATYARQLQRRAQRRQLVEAIERARERALDPELDPDQAQAQAVQAVLGAATAPGRGFHPATDAVRAVAEQLRSGARPRCVATGWEGLDRKLGGGLRPAELAVIAGRTGSGKSAFAACMALAAARRGLHVALASLEMPLRTIAPRLVAQWANLDVGAAYDGEGDAAAAAKAADALAAHAAQRLHVDDSQHLDVRLLRVRLLHLASRLRADGAPLGMVIVDYLQLIESAARNETRATEVARISRMLKQLAHDLDVPVVALSQLNRAANDPNVQEAGLEHLRESGAIEQDADLVLLIDPPRRAGDGPELVVKVAKNRRGPLAAQRFAFLRHATLFRELAPEPSDAAGAASDIGSQEPMEWDALEWNA